MGPNGGVSGGDGSNNGGQQQGTEYTLQGGEHPAAPFSPGKPMVLGQDVWADWYANSYACRSDALPADGMASP